MNVAVERDLRGISRLGITLTLEVNRSKNDTYGNLARIRSLRARYRADYLNDHAEFRDAIIPYVHSSLEISAASRV